MTDFLIKSTVAMGVLLGLYYILFEREKMHRFNRFYLLSALLFSLALPFITVYTYIQKIPASSLSVGIMTASSGSVTTIEQPVDYTPYIGWGLYSIVTFLLIMRFIRNTLHFTRKAAANPKSIMGSAKLVLLEEKTLPHTFLNYIFLNRGEYESKKIEDELYTHEYTHVKQKHTLDILFIEVLKTIFWFNPLLYCYKKAIQLNHEFLADEKVIDSTANTVYYQSLLLEKATVGTTFSMASNLTFSLTKKRFLMMTKTTSTKKAGILKLTILPVVTGLMMLLCTETVAQNSTPKQKEDAERQARIDKMIVPDHVMDSLKAANPDMFSKDLNIRYKNIKFSFTHKDGTVTEIIGYKNLNEKQKKLVSYAPEMYNMDMGFHDDEETIPDPVIKTGTKQDAGDPYVKYKKTKFRFTDKNGNVATKTGYRTLTEEDKKKIAPILPSLRDSDLVEYYENGTNPHQVKEPLAKYNEVSSHADYPGGLTAFNSYFIKNFSIPKIAPGIYRVYMSFIVEKDGSISDIKCLRADKELIDETIRVIKESDKWIPATKDGNSVRTVFNIPLTINVK